MVKFVVRKNGVLETFYADEDLELFEAIGQVEKSRFSHIDPIQPLTWLGRLYYSIAELFCTRLHMVTYDIDRCRGNFGIFWKGDLKRKWTPSFCDEAGRPFRTKAAAEKFEVAKLERDYFKTIPSGVLLVQGWAPLKGPVQELDKDKLKTK